MSRFPPESPVPSMIIETGGQCADAGARVAKPSRHARGAQALLQWHSSVFDQLGSQSYRHTIISSLLQQRFQVVDSTSIITGLYLDIKKRRRFSAAIRSRA